MEAPFDGRTEYLPQCRRFLHCGYRKDWRHKATLVEKKQTLVENGLPQGATRNLVEKENSWEDQADEKNFKKNTVHLMKKDSLEFAENGGWIQVGKKGVSFSSRKIGSHSISK